MKKLIFGTKQQDIGKLFFDKFSHKKIVITAGTRVAHKAQDLQNVPLETLQAYNLVGNRHEKRAKIHEYAQQIGNTYANIMQKLNAEENISSYDLQNFANGINFLVENKQKITPNMITTLEKATNNVAKKISLLAKYNQNIDPNMINALVMGIDSLTQQNQNINSDKITALEKATNNVANQIGSLLENQNQNIDHNMLNALARGIDSLTQQNQNIAPNMIMALENATRNVANQIDSLLKNQNQNIDHNMIKALASGIDSLLSSNIKKDLSYELKVLSKAILIFVKNFNDNGNYDTLNQLKNIFDSLETKVLKKESSNNELTINLESGVNNYRLALKIQQATYGKDAQKIHKYDRNSSEIYNFKQGYESFSILYDTFSDAQQQQENKIQRREQIKSDINITLIKLKSPKTFKDDISFDKIMQEYAYKDQEEVGVKNSDIRIVENDIVFFTHQYDSSKPRTDWLLYNGNNILIQKDSKVEIANNNKNITKLNELISILKPQCHENSYACLTHLVHRAIQRYGQIDGGYDLDKTISSVKELLKLKDTILNSSRKQVNIKDITTIIGDINSLSSSKYDIEKTQNIINSLSSFLKNIDDEDTKKAIQEQIEKLKIIQCINSKPRAITYANKIVKKFQNKIVRNIKKEMKEFLEAEPESQKEKVALGKIPVDMSNECIEIKKQYIQSVKEHETLEKECNEYKNKYDFNGEVADIKKLKEELVGKLKEYTKKQFTLSYSNQGDKYNYNAYELTTELGTLIIDNKGKISTIINKTI